MQKIVKIITKYWPLFLLLLLTFLLRIYRIEDLFYSSYDEEIPAFVGRKLILWRDFFTLGGVTPFGFHLGPYFYLFLTVLLYIGKLNPVIWGWAGAAIATVTTLMMFQVGKEFFNKKVGFLASSFWTFSYLAIIYDRHFWALFWGPVIALITLYSFFQIIKGKEKYVYLLGTTLAFAIHTDPSNLVFVLLSALVYVFYKLPIKKNTIIALSIIFISFAPLVLFDIRHDFANTKPALEYFQKGREHPANNPQNFWQNSLFFPKVFSRLIYPFGDNEIAKNYSYCPNYVNEKFKSVPFIFIVGTSIITLAFVFTSFKKTAQYRLLALPIIIYFVGIQFFGTVFKSDIFEHYITGLFAVFLIILAFFAAKLPKKIWLIVLAGFIILNLQKLFSAQNSMGLTYKRQAIQYTMREIKKRDFSLDSLSTCWRYGGYRYLFAVFGREPVKSYVDPNLAHLYGPTKVAFQHPETVVVFVTHDFVPETDSFYKQYARLKAHEVENSIFGNIEVIILDNSQKWFF